MKCSAMAAVPAGRGVQHGLDEDKAWGTPQRRDGDSPGSEEGGGGLVCDQGEGGHRLQPVKRVTCK